MSAIYRMRLQQKTSAKSLKNMELSVEFNCLPTEKPGRPRGFAFVEMGTEAEETAAIEALDGAEWMGRDLKVNKAKPREDRRSSGGGGNWGNSGRSSRRNYN
jgi:RNA recognition motif-containing protein